MALDQTAVEHLLRRTEYVARATRVQELMALATLDLAVDNILAVTTPVALPITLTVTNPTGQYTQFVYAQQWWLDRMAFDSPRPIQERMTFFWHGHFTSEWQKVDDTKMMMSQNKLYRDNALGNFASLAQAMAIEPAMLRYLDNEDNTKTSPNQNFARELMELFLLGVGNYTEADVQTAAAAWTGYSLDASNNFVIKATKHDATVKTFFTASGPLNGPDIITEILNSKKQIVARYIVGKLWNYFATPVGPQPGALDAIAAAFAASWDISAAVKAILLLPEFYSTATKQGLVRSPVDWIVAVMALTGYRGAVLNPQWYVDEMGQVPYNPPNVSGWRANAAWVNTSTIGARGDFALDVVNRMRNDATYNWTDLWTMTNDAAINAVATKFAIAPLSATTIAGMQNYAVAEHAAKDKNSWWFSTNLLTMALLAPEMHVA